MARKSDPLDDLAVRLKEDVDAHRRRTRHAEDPKPPAQRGRPAARNGDVRGRLLKAEARDNAQVRKRLELALGAAGVTLSDERVGALVDDLETIRAAANVSQAQYLRMGEALLHIQSEAGDGGYKAIYQAGLIPIPEATASRLRVVAAAVRDGRISTEVLPRTLEPAYYAAKLADEDRKRLLDADVIRPDTSSREIIKASRPMATPASPVRALTPPERRRLERERERLLARIAEIDELLAS